jgi:hypothetical protein
MEQLQRAAIVFSLIERLFSNGSWCGETHIQKSTYFLQELFEVPLEYNFILYKYGPFSFDFRDELLSWRADDLLRIEIRNQYGPSILPSENGIKIETLYSRTLGKYARHIDAVSSKLGTMGVTQLERWATAFYVTRKSEGSQDIELRARQITDLKPHVSYEDATQAIKDVDSFIAESKSFVLTC